MSGVLRLTLHCAYLWLLAGEGRGGGKGGEEVEGGRCVESQIHPKWVNYV